MALICSVTNQPAEEPVVSKFGHIYEKRVIEKYLETHDGKCPHTNEPLTSQDLIAVKVFAFFTKPSSSNATAASKIVKPRPAAATSVPGLLQLMQNEWDSLMVETFTLKQQLDTVRQELAGALYQHDASCRVIARLVKERDEARGALASMKATIGANGTFESSAPAAAPASAMEVDSKGAAAAGGIPEAITEKVAKHAAELQGQRRGRKPSANLAKPEDIAAYKVVNDFPGMHSAATPGVLCVDLSPEQSQIVTGGADKLAIVLDRSSGKEVAKLTGHSGKVLDVAFHPDNGLVLTASADATVMSWVPETKGRKKGYKAAHTFSSHKAEVVGISVHPLKEYFTSASVDRSWALHDLASGQTIHRFADAAPQGGYHSIHCHPDGQLLGLGTAEGAVQVWDVKAQQLAVTFPGHRGAMVSLSFSENGYYLATAAADNNVKLWDMRKQAVVATHTVEGLTTVSFDYSGSYILAGSATGPVVLKSKTLEVARPANAEHAVTDGVWGNDAAFFVTVSTDRSLKIWGK